MVSVVEEACDDAEAGKAGMPKGSRGMAVERVAAAIAAVGRNEGEARKKAEAERADGTLVAVMVGAVNMGDGGGGGARAEIFAAVAVWGRLLVVLLVVVVLVVVLVVVAVVVVAVVMVATGAVVVGVVWPSFVLLPLSGAGRRYNGESKLQFLHSQHLHISEQLTPA
jgi:hypothetical protein